MTFSSLVLSLKQKYYLPVSIGIILSISLSSGLFYFYESYQNYSFSYTFEDFSDIELKHAHIIWHDTDGIRYCSPNVNFPTLFAETDEIVNESLQNSGLRYQNYIKYGLLAFDIGFVSTENYSQIKEVYAASTELIYKKECVSTELIFNFFQEDYYLSERFTNYFTIIEGKAPSSPDEILIDYGMASKYGFGINSPVNITTRIGSILKNPIRNYPVLTNLMDFRLTNINVSGIYVPRYYTFTLDQEDYRYSYNYQDFQQNRLYSENNWVDKPAIFTYSNFTEPNYRNVAQELFSTIQNSSFAGFLQRTITKSGYSVFYSRNAINYKNIHLETKQIDNQISNLMQSLPVNIGISNIISPILLEFMQESTSSNFILQLLNIPIIMFSLYFGLTSQKSIEERRNNELFHLKVKGFPSKAISSQILKESVIFGIIDGILGMILGLIIFFGYFVFLGPIFLDTFPVFLLPFISFTSIIISLVLGIISHLLINIPIIRKVKKTHFDELYKKFNKDPNIIQTNNLVNITEDENKSGEYFEKKWKNGSNSFAKFLIVLGLLPFFLLFLPLVAIKIPLPDFLIDIVEILSELGILFDLLVIISMISFITGIITILYQKPPKIIKICLNSTSKWIFQGYEPLIYSDIFGNRKRMHIGNKLTQILAINIFINFLFYSTSALKLLPIELNSSIQDGVFDSMISTEFYHIILNFIAFASLILAIIVGISESLVMNENFEINKMLYNRGLKSKIIQSIFIYEILFIFILGMILGTIIGFIYALLVIGFKYVIIQLQFSISSYLKFSDVFTFNFLSYLIILVAILLISSSISFFLIKRQKFRNSTKALESKKDPKIVKAFQFDI
ncbi:hypothetical protein NEF87_000775 [Candidatus Lokiarchaeum ossiferum]|uniref:ABC3 transporter permease protein domain-containing protein n=1 Tax=Candidatus Lokiarchaeum ossiferum TaxID=2951803 RepID=A0ABY6HLU7_9ARCH|nr:hypothetical protein NEF87_000775 [Candidatus Lokiarchaeum sp. B-35]